MRERRMVALVLLSLTFCMPRMMTLLGELDGQHVDASTAFTQWAIQQLTLPYSMDLPTDGSILHLEWTTGILDGGSAAASGTVVMPANAPRAGETICAATGTMGVRPLSSGGGNSDYPFTLTDLSSGPTCPGTSLAGSLAGCAQTMF
jgi:hypothetical protein